MPGMELSIEALPSPLPPPWPLPLPRREWRISSARDTVRRCTSSGPSTRLGGEGCLEVWRGVGGVLEACKMEVGERVVPIVPVSLAAGYLP